MQIISANPPQQSNPIAEAETLRTLFEPAF